MDFFPDRDLSDEISGAFLDGYLEGQSLGLSPVLEVYLRGEGAPRPLPGPEQRAVGLATIWSEVKYNFAFWDHLDGEDWWDDQFAKFLPRVLAAESPERYWELLEEFALLAGEAHTLVRRPLHLLAELAYPPLVLACIEGRAVVWEGEALPRGTEILSVDGRPVDEVQREVGNGLATSTPQSKLALATAWLLRGTASTEVSVHVRLPDRVTRDLTLQRTLTRLTRPPVAVRALGDGLHHVEINEMTQEALDRFQERFATFDGVSGLIIDLRWNHGGSSRVGHAILSRMLNAAVRAPRAKTRAYVPWVRGQGGMQRWVQLSVDPIEPDLERPRFLGPLAVLASARTGSAAEDFLLSYVESRRGPVIGEPSAGSSGQPVWTPLPGGGLVQVTTIRESFPDGTEFVGKGVMPTIPCAPTIRGVGNGRDEVLDEAVAWLAQVRGQARLT